MLCVTACAPLAPTGAAPGYVAPMSLGMLAALGSALAWAVGAILFRRIGERASPSAMNLAKSLMGIVLLGVAVAVTGVSPIDRESLWRLAASGVLGIAVGDTLFFAALVRLEPRTTLLLASVGHVFAVLLSVLLLGERPTGLAWVGIALVIGGVGWVLQAGAEVPQEGASGAGAAGLEGAGKAAGKGAAGLEAAGKGAAGRWPSERVIGILCGVGSALATSSSLLLAKTGVGGDVSTLEAAWVRLAAGVVAVGLVSAARGHLRADLGVLRLPGLVRELGVAVIVVMFGGFWLSLVSLRYADASVATALAATEPVFVLPLAKWWLGERVTIAAVVAACVVVIGVGLIVVGTG